MAKQKTQEVKVNPATRDKAGNLLKLRPADFPKTTGGKLGYIDYSIEKLEAKKEHTVAMADPQKKKKAKRDKLKEQLAQLEKELREEESKK